jgi:hypothetical protein
MSHVIVWEFLVKSGREGEFEDVYGARGAWARLFAKSPDHVGTELLRDTTTPNRYLTIDRWKAAGSFGEFREAHRAEYEALDARCEGLTEREAKVGRWTGAG